MNSLVIYFSKFGNTQIIAEAIAVGLGSAGPVQALHLDNLSQSIVKEADLVVMGSPTHNMNLPKAVQSIIANLPKRMFIGKHVAVFDTSYQMSWFLNIFTAGKKLSRNLRRLGGKQILKPEIFLVEKREGPLVVGEVERSGAWAKELLSMMTK